MRAAPDSIIRKREKQRAIERWENEGGNFIHADFGGAHPRGRNDRRASPDGAAEGRHGIEARPFATPGRRDPPDRRTSGRFVK